MGSSVWAQTKDGFCKAQAELRFACCLGAHSLPGTQSSSKEWDGDFKGPIVGAMPRQRQHGTWGLMTKPEFTGQADGYLPGVAPDDVEHSCPCVHGPSWKPKWFSFLAKSICEHWEWIEQVTIWGGG